MDFCAAIGIAALVGIVIWVAQGLVRSLTRVTHCQLCGNQLGRSQYTMEIAGQKPKTICHYCRDQISRRQSRKAVQGLYGEE